MEAKTDGTIKKKYHGGIFMEIPAVADVSCKQTYYYLYDGLGDVVNLVDGYGNLVQTYYYDAFGKSTNVKHDVVNKKQFTGKEIDEDSGLYYFLARYYDPETGRFLSEDPVPYLNLYVYCDNNPVNKTDPDGREKVDAIKQTITDIGRTTKNLTTYDPYLKKEVTYNPKQLSEDLMKMYESGKIKAVKMKGEDSGSANGGDSFEVSAYSVKAMEDYTEINKNPKINGAYNSEITHLEAFLADSIIHEYHHVQQKVPFLDRLSVDKRADIETAPHSFGVMLGTQIYNLRRDDEKK